MELRQTTILLLGACLGCAPASTVSAERAPAEAPAAAPAWVTAVQSEADALSVRYPDATVRIAVVDVSSGDIVASHGPIDRAHPTGSTVKSFTIAAALAAGVDPAAQLDTGEGTTAFGSTTVRDHTGHGTINVTQALALSSNVAIIRLVEQVGAGELYRRVGDLIPLPKPSDDETAGEILFGAHLTLSTAELAHGYAVLAGGGTDPETGDRLVDAEAASQVVQMLEHAVTAPDGTGRRAAVEGRTVAGKTGTAPSGDAHTALFFGITEAQGRKVVVGVVVDGVPKTEFGGSVAAPAFARIISQTEADSST